jgi:hypothetical protein
MFLDNGELANEMPVHEYQLARCTGDPKLPEFIFRKCLRTCQFEWHPCDRRNARESPVFIVSSGESHFAEAREGVVTQSAQPGEIMARSPLLKFREAIEISS